MQSNNGITVNDLLEASFKHSNQKWWDGYKELYGKEPESRRHPDTIQGFITKEKLNEMFTTPDKNQLLIASGLVIISDGKAFFLSDDLMLGYKVIPETFVSCSISNLHYNFGPGREFPTVDSILSRYCKDERHLNSLEELVSYINTNNGFASS